MMKRKQIRIGVKHRDLRFIAGYLETQGVGIEVVAVNTATFKRRNYRGNGRRAVTLTLKMPILAQLTQQEAV